MTTKVIATGKTHNVSGTNGSAKSADGFLDIAMPDPHPAAENLFGAAWSACFMGALQYAAAQKKIALPAAPSIDAEVNLNLGDEGFFLSARLNVSVPGLERSVAQALVETAQEICPYSKATRGNIDVAVTLA
jgi:Ohr subfamily peroxiredoxin